MKTTSYLVLACHNQIFKLKRLRSFPFPIIDGNGVEHGIKEEGEDSLSLSGVPGSNVALVVALDRTVLEAGEP